MSEPIEKRRTSRRREAKQCKHFNGVQHEHCNAGVRYDDLVPKGTFGRFFMLPCHNDKESRDQATCASYAERTEEEYEADERAFSESMSRMRLVMPVVSEWRKKPPRGKREVIECPACKGRLHLSQSAYNGHVWGRCETDGCVAWME